MSSLVIQYPVVRLLLKRHREHNLEYAAIAPFQTLMTILFPAIEGYAVNMEQSVDRRAARVDMLVHGTDFDHDTLFIVMIGELKASYKPPSEGESQLLLRAREAIVAHELEMVYGYTTLGEGFRFWVVSAQTMTLEPLFSDTPRGSRSAYIPLDSAEGDCIIQLCNYIKENRPLRQATVLPSQSFPVSDEEPYGHASQANPPAEESSFNPNQYIPASPSGYYGQSYQPPEPSTQYESEPPVTSSMEHHNDPGDLPDQSMEMDEPPNDSEDEPVAGPSQATGAQQGATYKMVKITKEEHSIRSNKYFFRKHRKGRVITTKIEDWNEVTAGDGRKVWYYKEDTKYWGYKPR
ncbi:hypothetical protein CCHR01_14342 [Colletotrichum chrysophilum]|uniref:Uncharacterized protein n=1 Tax=Colletotrichum chrysophilum TaxID=1836956 RepID=A0AAD9AAE1_9PEZI|nr:hypothetical protein CCHR01_14342 [Colletotrichum chrysophilum]